jgi:FkbM family methyltransferase
MKLSNKPTTSSLRRIKDRLYRNWVLKPALKLFRYTDRESHFWLLGPEVAHRDTICREIMLDGYYEKDLLAAMVELVPDKTGTFLDIGANIGNHSIYLSKHFRRVISFEPVPRNCWIFKANRHLNRAHNITLVEKGLSSKPAQLYFGCEDPMQTNTGLHKSENGSEDAEAAEVVRGDDALQALGISNVVGVKIDVEGHEPEVIRGLEATLRSNRPLVFWEAFSHDSASHSENILRELGYTEFSHLGTAPKPKLKILGSLNASTMRLVPLNQCTHFSGLNMASF